MRVFALGGIISVFVFTACGPLLLPKSGGEVTRYVIDERFSENMADSRQPLGLRLLIRDVRANSFISSQKIVFSENNATRGYYQFARWVEPPNQRIAALLQERFERAGLFESVSRLGSSTIGDVQLNVELAEFRHDISSSPGEVKIEFLVELIDLKKHEILCQNRVAQSIDSETYSAAGAVEAFSKGVNTMIDGLVIWTHDCALAQVESE